MAVILGIIVVASAVTAYSLNALQPKSVPQQEEHNQGEDDSTITITIITTAQVQGAAKQNFETEAERKILGINKSTLWYQEKKLAEVCINVLGGECNKSYISLKVSLYALTLQV